MTDQQSSSSAIAIEASSRQKATSPDLPTTSPPATASTPLVNEDEPLPEDGQIEADDDSAYGDSTGGSLGGTSISSTALRGHYENGRRYQVMREQAMNFPSDDKHFKSMEAAHLMYTIIESQQKNPFFRSPISNKAQHILDLGTGTGAWANDVADLLPNLTVHGVDLYPPPTEWVAPNCILEVDDFNKPWTWSHKFDLIHIRLLVGALPRAQWKKLYKQAYDNLEPGGWIEHVECDAHMYSNDTKPMPKDSLLSKYADTLLGCTEKAGVAADITDFMKEEIEAVGFTNIQVKKFQIPIGDWPKHPVYKDAGRLQMEQFRDGLEGWCIWALTKFGSPAPWSMEETQVWLAMIQNEIAQGYHLYQFHTRVWAQKPYDAPKTTQEPTV